MAMASVPDGKEGLVVGEVREEETVVEKEDILINGNLINVDKNMNAKSILSMYCQKMKVRFPKYDVNIMNKNLPTKRYFICVVELEDKKAFGRSKKRKEAEMFSARRMVSGNFLAGNNYCQSKNAIHQPNRGRCPSKQTKSLGQLDKWARNLEAERSEVSQGEVDNSKDIPEASIEELELFEDIHMKYSIIFFDLERSAGNIDSEIIQLSAIGDATGESVNWYVIPEGEIDAGQARFSHKLRFVKGRYFRGKGKESYQAISFEAAADEFIKFCKKEQELTGKEVVIVFYDGKDDFVLLNNLASTKQDREFLEQIAGSIDLMDIFKDDISISSSGVALSLTKLREGRKNISEYFLGDEIKKEISASAHDSLFDAKLLRRVWKEYFSNKENKMEIMNTYLLSTNSMLRCAKEFIRKLELKRGNKATVARVFNAWGDWHF